MSKSILRTHLMILGLVLTTTITAQAAEPQCTLRATIAECQPRIAQDQKILKQRRAAQMPTFLDIAKNADGSLKYMNHADAIQYCSSQGAHLPSARELAQLSKSFGARGIVRSCGLDKKCLSILAINADGTSDSFNYSYAGYQRPSGDLGDGWFWSSSVLPVVSNGAYGLNTDYGAIDVGVVDHDSTVRCVLRR